MNNELLPQDTAAPSAPLTTLPNEIATGAASAHVAPVINGTHTSDGGGSETADTHPPAAPDHLTWDALGLEPEILSALEALGYLRPTPVQATVYGPVRAGKDLLVQSRTGTGKTTAFGLPIVAGIDAGQKDPQALILAPTRELAIQVTRELRGVGKDKGVVIETLYGGAPIGKQVEALRKGVHIVVGTPGRVLDHIGRRTLDTSNIRMFVLDECDEMLSMGFLEDIERVVSHLSKDRQTALFSATMPDEVRRYARRHMKAPELITLSADQLTVSDIHHAYYVVSGIARPRDLLRVLFAENPESAIIFCNTRDETTTVARFLQRQGLDAEPISSDLSQAERERVMQRCKAKNLRFLVATDVAARGIDISDLSHVINYAVQDSPEVYVHRTGRTGRAGKKGTAISLVGPRELGAFRYVRLQYKIAPEERPLPPWSILEGKLKVPLPTLGAPVKPDPVVLITEAVKGPASDAQLDVVRRLVATPEGERVLAVLVSERLIQMRPKRPRPVAEEVVADDRWGADRGERGARGGRDRDDRPSFRDRPSSRDRSGGGRDYEPREGRQGSDRGPEREDRFSRGSRPRWDESRRDDARHERGHEEGRRWRGGRDEHADGDAAVVAAEPAQASATEHSGRGEHRGDRHDRDRHDRHDRNHGERRPERDHSRPERDHREARDHRDRDRSQPAPGARGDDRFFDRDRGGRFGGRRPSRDTEEWSATERAAVETNPPITVSSDTAAKAPSSPEAPPSATEQAAPSAAAKADRSERPRNGRSEPREFWETWADAKAARPTATAPFPADTAKAGAAKAAPATAAAEAASATASDKATSIDKAEAEKGKRGARSKKGTEKPGKRADAKADSKSETESKADKKGAKPKDAPPPPSAPSLAPVASGDQVRLHVGLGKQHSASAADVRSFLAGFGIAEAAQIGSVMLRDTHSYVKVPASLADRLVAKAHNKKHGAAKVTVQKA